MRFATAARREERRMSQEVVAVKSGALSLRVSAVHYRVSKSNLHGYVKRDGQSRNAVINTALSSREEEVIVNLFCSTRGEVFYSLLAIFVMPCNSSSALILLLAKPDCLLKKGVPGPSISACSNAATQASFAIHVPFGKNPSASPCALQKF